MPNRYDPVTGCHYYIDHHTKSTTWDRPTAPTVKAVADAAEAMAAEIEAEKEAVRTRTIEFEIGAKSPAVVYVDAYIMLVFSRRLIASRSPLPLQPSLLHLHLMSHPSITSPSCSSSSPSSSCSLLLLVLLRLLSTLLPSVLSSPTQPLSASVLR